MNPGRRLTGPGVAVDGRELPGTALGWRGQRVNLPWVDDTLQPPGWVEAGRVRRR